MEAQSAKSIPITALMRLVLALVFALGLASALQANKAYAADPEPIAEGEAVTVALTVVDTSDGTVVFNDVVEGLTTESTVADMLKAAGLEYTESYGSPEFLGKGYDAETGSYWVTMSEGSGDNYADAQLTAKLKDQLHYQYIYGSDYSFEYTDEIADPLAATEPEDEPEPETEPTTGDPNDLIANLTARFSMGGSDGAISNATTNAAVALANLGLGDQIDVEAVLANLTADDTMTAGRLGKYIIILTAAGEDCTAITIDGNERNLIAEMEGLMTGVETIYDVMPILIAYDYGQYEQIDAPLTKDNLIQTILDAQVTEGDSAGLFGPPYESAQTAAQAILALKPYKDSNEQVAAALDLAVSAILSMQNPDGGISYDLAWAAGYSDVDTTGEAAAALAALGVNPSETRSQPPVVMSTNSVLVEKAYADEASGASLVDFLVGAADETLDGYNDAAGQYLNESMMSADAFVGLVAAKQLTSSGSSEYYIYTPVDNSDEPEPEPEPDPEPEPAPVDPEPNPTPDEPTPTPTPTNDKSSTLPPTGDATMPFVLLALCTLATAGAYCTSRKYQEK